MKGFSRGWPIGLGSCLVALCCAGLSGQRPVPPELKSEIEAGLSISGRLALTGEDTSAVQSAWDRMRAEPLLVAAGQRIKNQPRDFRGYALRFLALLEIKGDRDAAHQCAVRATRALAGEPEQLAEFVLRALLVHPSASDRQLAVMSMTPAVADARDKAVVRTAHVCALLAAGKRREAELTNKTVVADIAVDVPGLLRFAQAVAEVRNGVTMSKAAKQAIDKVIEKQGETVANLMVRYRIEHDLVGDEAASKATGGKILQRIPLSDLNDWTWELMTTREMAGLYPSLALLAAHRMEQAELGYHELDTIALAHFCNGQLDRAIQFQTRAIAAGGANDGDYRRRLKTYQRASRAAKAQDKKAAPNSGRK